jgi:predicted cation transporter
MTPGHRIRSILLALLVSGGMLVPGSVCNIVCSQKLGLGAQEWARRAVPLGSLRLLAS